MSLSGTYLGIVEDNADPLSIGRIKARVPHIYGPSKSDLGAIATKDIPWALPAGMPAGTSPASGGMSWLPEPGDQVYIRFLDSEPEKPIWEWGNQTSAGAQALNLHLYGANGGGPVRGAITRYGHTIEFNEDAVLTSTKNGNAWMLDDYSDSGILTVNGCLVYNVGDQWAVTADGLDFAAVERMRFSADTAIAFTSADMALCINTDYILQAGNSVSVFAGDEECSTMALKDGMVVFTDMAGSVMSLGGDGSGILSASDGSYVSVNTSAVTLFAAPLEPGLPGPSIMLDSIQNAITFSSNAVNFDGGITAGVPGMGYFAMLGSAIMIQMGSSTFTVTSETTTVESGGHTLTISSSGFNFV